LRIKIIREKTNGERKMSNVDLEDYARFKESVKKCSRTCSIKHVPVKAHNGGPRLIKGAEKYCTAVFTCSDKWLKRIRQQNKTGNKRIYQICHWRGHCNQQLDTPVFWEVP